MGAQTQMTIASLTCLIKGSFEGHEYEEVPLSSVSLSEETVLTRSLTTNILQGLPRFASRGYEMAHAAEDDVNMDWLDKDTQRRDKYSYLTMSGKQEVSTQIAYTITHKTKILHSVVNECS